MIHRETSKRIWYMTFCLEKKKKQYPMTGEPRLKETESFARNLHKRLLKVHPLIFKGIKLHSIWQDTVEYLEFHGHRRYIEDLLLAQYEMAEEQKVKRPDLMKDF